MKLTSYEIFASVVEAGTISAAAEALDISKAKVSRDITRLEEDLGARLLDRSTRTVRPTAIGAQFFQRCLSIRSAIRDAGNLVDEAMDRPQGPIRVIAPFAVAIYMIGPFLGDYLRRYPEVRIAMHLRNDDANLMQEAADIAIVFGPVPDTSLVRRSLGRPSLGLYASPRYIEAHGRPERVEHLPAHRLADVRGKIGPRRWTLDVGGETKRIRVDPRLCANDPSLILNGIRAGEVIGFLPSFMAEQDVGEGTPLLRLLPACRWREPEILALYTERRGAAPSIVSFLDHLAQSFGSGRFTR